MFSLRGKNTPSGEEAASTNAHEDSGKEALVADPQVRKKIEKHPPKHCPQCGSGNTNYVELWAKSQWMCDTKNPDWIPFQGIGYDTYCYDCEWSGDIEPDEDMNIYWFDEYPEELPPEGNKYYSDILLKRNPPSENCGNCNHFLSGFVYVEGTKYSTLKIHCDLDKSKKVRYFRPCVFEPSKWEPSDENDS